MSLESRILAAIQAIGADVKALFTGKQPTLVSGTNIKTVNGHSLLGSGDVLVPGGGTTPAVQMVTTDPLPVVSGGISLPLAPIGNVVWNTALVYVDLTPDDLDPAGALRGTRDYQVQEHVVRTVGNQVVFVSQPPDDSHAVVSYLVASP